MDTGISYRHGQRLKEAIRAVTDRPVKLVILTHAVREFVFGAGAFEEIGAIIAAHRETLDLMKARCAHCLEQLKEQLGDELDGTRLVLPVQIFDGTTTLSAGGVEIDIIYAGWASTPGDVAIFHTKSGTLLAGGLVTSKHVRTIREADIWSWNNEEHHDDQTIGYGNSYRIFDPIGANLFNHMAQFSMDKYYRKIGICSKKCRWKILGKKNYTK